MCVDIGPMIMGASTEKLVVPKVLRREDFLRLPPHERERYVRQIIRDPLNLNTQGVTVTDLARFLPFGPRTIEKHLSILSYTNEIYSVFIGPTAVYHPNSKVMHPLMEKSLKIADREFTLFTLENRFGRFVLIQEHKGRQLGIDVGEASWFQRKDFEASLSIF